MRPLLFVLALGGVASAASGAGGRLVQSFGTTDIDTSAELATILTDETGSGAACFGTSPTISTPTLAWAVATKTTNYTLVAGDHIILCDATAGAVTLTGPAAASHAGRIYQVKKIDASANSCTFDPNGAETVDGAATKTNTTQYQSFTFTSNGTNWFIL